MVRLNWEAGIRRCTFHFGRIMMVLRDVNNTDIFRPYSNSMQSGRVFIRLYSIPSIQYP